MNSLKPCPHTDLVRSCYEDEKSLHDRPDNLHKNTRVTLALDDTKEGEDVVIVEGTAELLDNPDISATLPAYVEKYAAKMKEMGSTPEAMAADFSVGIRITPTKFRSWA